MAYRFFSSCVDWPPGDVETGLMAMVDAARSVTRRTFCQHVDHDDRRDLEAALGYARAPRHGLTIAADCCVTYYRSTLHGRRVYFLTWSAIEHVFT